MLQWIDCLQWILSHLYRFVCLAGSGQNHDLSCNFRKYSDLHVVDD